jgi:hypothetical protein
MQTPSFETLYSVGGAYHENIHTLAVFAEWWFQGARGVSGTFSKNSVFPWGKVQKMPKAPDTYDAAARAK